MNSNSGTKSPGQGRRLLVVDDSAIQRKLLQQHFSLLGFRVDVASDGLQGLELAQKLMPDIIVSDVVMPKMDGFEMCQAVRQDKQLENVWLILVTSNAINESDRLLASSFGVDHFVPLTPGYREIMEAVLDVIEAANTVAPTAPSLTPEEGKVPAELRTRIIAEGEMDTRRMLENLESNFDLDQAKGMAHRWAGRGGTLGMPEISDQARRIEALLWTQLSGESLAKLRLAYEELLRFFAAAESGGSAVVIEKPSSPENGHGDKADRSDAVGIVEAEEGVTSEPQMPLPETVAETEESSLGEIASTETVDELTRSDADELIRSDAEELTKSDAEELTPSDAGEPARTDAVEPTLSDAAEPALRDVEESEPPAPQTASQSSFEDAKEPAPEVDHAALYNELQQRIISRGKQEAIRLLEALDSGFVLQEARSFAVDWWDKAETLGFTEISDQARRIDELLGEPRIARAELETAYRQMLQLFSDAEEQQSAATIAGGEVEIQSGEPTDSQTAGDEIGSEIGSTDHGILNMPEPSAPSLASMQDQQQPAESPPSEAFPGAEEAGAFAELRRKMAIDGEHEVLQLMKTLDSRFVIGDARQLAHSWAGRGGTFGFPKITAQARLIEGLLEKPATGRVIWELQNAYLEMLNLFAAARGESTATVEGPFSEQPPAPPAAEIPVGSETQESAAARVNDTPAASVPPIEDQATEAATPSGEAQVEAQDETKDETRDEAQDESDAASANAAHVAEPKPVTEGTAADAAPAARGKTSIVIADDDPTVTALVKATVKSYGMECFLAADGGEALELITKLVPSCAILDVNMPRMDGFEVLSALKNDARTRGVRVVLLTARQSEAEIMRGFSLGADDYIVKPFTPVELLARLRRLSKRKIRG